METALPDPDPLEPVPAGPPIASVPAGPPIASVPAGPLFVPVRAGSARCPSSVQARFFRTPLGARTAVAFTSERLLVATLGAGQQWVRLCEPALRDLAAPLGVRTLTVDPLLSAPRAADPHPSVPHTAAHAGPAATTAPAVPAPQAIPAAAVVPATGTAPPAPAVPDAPALVRHGR
ncbi:SAV_915 family protein [Streptomyces sp. NPDC008125]|uniref:SAV_915 family protein n=1 Tax=Streptomyces sp. NPDC008125 TaxID=3364811 RepID=UPI0036ED05E8